MVGIRGRGALIVDASFQCWTAPSSMWLLFLSIFSFSGAITLTGPQNVLENKPVTLTCKYTSTFSLEWFRNSRSFITCTTWRPCTYPTGYKSTLNQTTSVLHIDSVTTANKCWKCKPDHGTSPELCLNVEKLGHNITLSGKTRDPDSLTAWIDCSNPYYKNVVCYYKNKTTTKEFDHVISKPVSNCSSPTFKKTLVTINVTAQQLLSSRNYSAYCKATFGGSEADQTLTSNEITFWIPVPRNQTSTEIITQTSVTSTTTEPITTTSTTTEPITGITTEKLIIIIVCVSVVILIIVGIVTYMGISRHSHKKGKESEAPTGQKSPAGNESEAPTGQKSPAGNESEAPTGHKSPAGNESEAPTGQKSPADKESEAPTGQKSPAAAAASEISITNI